MSSKLLVLYYYLKFKLPVAYQSREAIERRQQKKIRRHLAKIGRTIPFYRPHRGAPLDSLPIMDKQTFMDSFHLLNSKGLTEEEAVSFAVKGERERAFDGKLRGITVGLSSGTSGRRGAFLVSDRESAMWAGYILSHCLPRGIFGRCRIAFFMRANSNLYESVGSKRIRFEFFDIFEDMERNMDRLNQFQPDILVGQPSVLLGLAEGLLQQRLTIAPEKIISVAEVLEEKDGARIKSAFGLEVLHQAYQCTEGCLALTCRFGHLHINEDIVYIEKEPMGGDCFIPIVTDYTRQTQPIVRYRLNDILHESSAPCPCGSHFLRLERIEGREDDIFVFPGRQGGKDVTVFPDFIRRCVLLAGKIEDYRIVQDEALTVYTTATQEEKTRIVREFQRLAEEKCFELPQISFFDYTTEPQRKLKRVERVKNDATG